MIEITVQEFEEKFEEFVDRAGEGESFLIKNPGGDLMMIPYEDYCEADEELKNMYCTGTNCADG
jgi:PHD/YefM family antitoxin component YafN of YafNO toxin-antitoxin module